MIFIEQNKALQRWDMLSDILREALCAEENSAFIWKTCGDEHISDEKIRMIAGMTGYVLMGFLRSDGLAKEIENATGIGAPTAASIADAIKKKIIDPLQRSIDNIPGVVAAPLKAEEKTENGGPMMIEKSPAAIMPKPVSWPAPTAPAPAPVMPKFPITNPPVKTPAVTAMPAPTSTPPTSKIAPQIFSGAPHIEASLPSSPEQPVKKFGFFAPKPRPQETAAPKPVILQETASFMTNKKSSDFHIETSDNKFQELPNVPRPLPQKAAVLEFGLLSKTPPTPKNSEASQKPAAGKYEGEFTELPSRTAPTPEKGRTMTEITPSFESSPKDNQPPQNNGARADENKNQTAGNDAATPVTIAITSETPAAVKIPPADMASKNETAAPVMPLHPRIAEENLLGEFAPKARIAAEKPVDKTIPAPQPPEPFSEIKAPVPATAPAPQPSAPSVSPIFGKTIASPQDSGMQSGAQKADNFSFGAMQPSAMKPVRPIVPAPSFAMPVSAPKPSFLAKLFKKEPQQPLAVIQKNYSEADMVPKPVTPPQTAAKNTITKTAADTAKIKTVPAPSPMMDVPPPSEKK